MNSFFTESKRKKVIIISILTISLINLIFGLSAIFNPFVVIDWKTETEIDTLGFNIYKMNYAGDVEFDRVNTEIIIAKGSPISGTSYSFIDRDVLAGRTYIYELREVQLDNQEKVIDQLEITLKNRGYVLIVVSIFLMIFPVLIKKIF